MVISYVLRLRPELAHDGTLSGEVEAVGTGKRWSFASMDQLNEILSRSLPEEVAKAELTDQRRSTSTSNWKPKESANWAPAWRPALLACPLSGPPTRWLQLTSAQPSTRLVTLGLKRAIWATRADSVRPTEPRSWHRHFQGPDQRGDPVLDRHRGGKQLSIGGPARGNQGSAGVDRLVGGPHHRGRFARKAHDDVGVLDRRRYSLGSRTRMKSTFGGAPAPVWAATVEVAGNGDVDVWNLSCCTDHQIERLIGGEATDEEDPQATGTLGLGRLVSVRRFVHHPPPMRRAWPPPSTTPRVAGSPRRRAHLAGRKNSNTQDCFSSGNRATDRPYHHPELAAPRRLPSSLGRELPPSS